MHLALELGFEGRIQVHQALLVMGKKIPLTSKDSKYIARMAEIRAERGGGAEVSLGGVQGDRKPASV